MILDEKKSILYLPDRNVRLSKMENNLLSIVLNKKNRVVGMGEILQKMFDEYDNAGYYIKKIQHTCMRINQKSYPYFQIKYKSNIYCYITVAEDEVWKKSFLKNHKISVMLLKKYKQLEELQNTIKKIKMKNY